MKLLFPLLLIQSSAYLKHIILYTGRDLSSCFKFQNTKVSDLKMNTKIKSTEDKFVDIEDLVSQYSSNNMLYDIDAVSLNYLRSCLLKWYRLNRRRLPWRGDQDISSENSKNDIIKVSPYGTWTVINYWLRWMQEYPTIESLSKATLDDVNRLWAGLGYYRRAKSLLDGATKVTELHNGQLPSDKVKLLTIPGIGPYTAGAILSIAFNQCEPLVDGNVIRVFSRLFAINSENYQNKNNNNNAIDKLFWELATKLVDPNDPGDFNQGLMELGATVCKPTSPSCDTCPLNKICKAKLLVDYENKNRIIDSNQNNNKSIKTFFKPIKLKSKDIIDLTDEKSIIIDSKILDLLPKEVTFFPIKIIKKAPKNMNISVCVLQLNVYDNIIPFKVVSKYLFVKRPKTGLLANQWEFPSIIIDSNNTDNNNDEDDENEDNNNNNNIELTSDKLWEPFPTYLYDKLGIKLPEFNNNSSNNNNNNNMNTISRLNINKLEEIETSKKPIIHIFSHQKHFMYINYKYIDKYYEQSNNNYNNNNSDVTMSWMTADEITQIGITTGCKKILDEIAKYNNNNKISEIVQEENINNNSSDIIKKEKKKIEENVTKSVVIKKRKI